MTLSELQKELGMEARPTGVFVSALASLGLLQVTNTDEGSEDLFANSPVYEIFLDKSKESWAISLPSSTSVSTRHGINLLNLFRRTNL